MPAFWAMFGAAKAGLLKHETRGLNETKHVLEEFKAHGAPQQAIHQVKEIEAAQEAEVAVIAKVAAHNGP